MFSVKDGKPFITACINNRFGVLLSESQNGFRAIKTNVLRALDLREDITTIEQEMIIKTLKKGFRMGKCRRMNTNEKRDTPKSASAELPSAMFTAWSNIYISDGDKNSPGQKRNTATRLLSKEHKNCYHSEGTK